MLILAEGRFDIGPRPSDRINVRTRRRCRLFERAGNVRWDCALTHELSAIPVLLVDREKPTEGFFAEIARVIKAPVAVQRAERLHFGVGQAEIEQG
jgi:hypothetical protein